MARASERLEIHSMLKWLNGQESLIAFTHNETSNLDAESLELTVKALHPLISYSEGIAS
jgi:hypothetical protein